MQKSFFQRTLFSVVLLAGVFLLSGCGFKEKPPEGYKVTLEVWGVFDDTDAYSKIIEDYKKINPFIKDIRYRKLSPETYKEDLLEAFATGKGPDIFMVRNAWRESFENKTAPAPQGVISEKEYRDALVDVAAADFLNKDNQIYGIPVSVDSLALYYNKDMFNAVGISSAPETWEEVVAAVQRLTQLDQFGNIIRSGIALGTGSNINRSSDILTLMMAQFGAELRNVQNGRMNFFGKPTEEAFDFYTHFSRIASPDYTWNARQHYSIDAFYEGTAAMMINYSWQYETLRQKNAKLNIGVAPLPQFNQDTPVNLANYWGYAVSKNRTLDADGFSPTNPATVVSTEKKNDVRILESWQFLRFLALAGEKKSMTLTNGLVGTSKEFPLTTDPTKTYLDKTRKPPARRDLVAEKKDDVVLAPFVYGNLIAKNWFQGDPEATEGIIIDMIDSVVRGEKTIQAALSVANTRINLQNR